MLAQPITGRFSDIHGRALFIFLGGILYGVLAIAFPFVSNINSSVLFTIPRIGEFTTVILTAIVLNGMFGIADAFREPASMALFADEGKGEGITSSLGLRDLVWQPGSVLAPLLGGWLMAIAGIEWVFFVAGIASFSAVVTFAGILSQKYGRQALVEW